MISLAQYKDLDPMALLGDDGDISPDLAKQYFANCSRVDALELAFSLAVELVKHEWRAMGKRIPLESDSDYQILEDSAWVSMYLRQL